MSRRVTGLAVMAMALASALPASAQTIGLRLRDSAQVLLAPSAPLRVPVVLDLGAAGSANLAALQAALTWDAALLRFDSLVAVPGSGLTLTVQAGEAATGRVRFSAYGSSAVSASGPLAEVFLTARTATGGTWLTLVPEVAGAEDGSSVLPLLRTRQLGACVASGTGVWGDVNDDAVVNVLDAQQIARFGVGLNVAQPAAMAARGDVTADGAVNVLDAQQIARASVGLSAAPRIGRSAYTPPPVASLAVSRLWPLVLPLQAWSQLIATPRGADGTPLAGCQPVSWSSNDPAVASVTSTGQVVATANGSTRVNAASGAITASPLVTAQGLPPTPARSLAVGPVQACRLDATGQASCWGAGLLAPTPVLSPVPFAALQVNFSQCGLTATGRAYCWGPNTKGEVGDGTLLSRTSPTAVVGDLTFASLAVAGGNGQGGRTCGLTPEGEAYCWGWNLHGSLGIGSTAEFGPVVPTPVAGGLRFVAIAGDWLHSCALTEAGAAYCWGWGFSGIGDGTNTSRSVPTAVTGALTFAQIETGYYHSCGLTPAGAAYCWGQGSSGALGDGGISARLSPVAVAGGLTFEMLSAGDGTTCGLSAGQAYCWGYTGERDLNGTSLKNLTPTLVPGGLTFSTIGVGQGFACGITTGGQTYCWGRNVEGQVGDGTTTYRPQPTLVP